MKINQNRPVGITSGTNKSSRASATNAFGNILDAELQETDQLQPQQRQEEQSGQSGGQAWQALEESVSLLDQAMQCLESGEEPAPELLQNIELLREQLRQQLATGHTADLSQADTLLAVEAERIRSMQQ